MPTFGSIFFVPILFGLAGILKCREAIGEDLNDAFLDKDCNTFCWSGQHTYYSILGMILMFIFTLVLSIYKTITIRDLDSSTIKFSSYYMYLKTLLQIILVLLNFSMK